MLFDKSVQAVMFEYEPVVIEHESWCVIEDTVENVADGTVTEELLEVEAPQKLHAVESEVETIGCEETPGFITEFAVEILPGEKLLEVEAGKDELRAHSTSFTTANVTSSRIQELNRLQEELKASKYKLEDDLQLLVAEQTRFRQQASYTGEELARMNTAGNLIIKTKKDLQDLAKEQEILEIKTSLMTHELRLEELEESKTKLGRDVQTCAEKQANLETKASSLLAREEAVTTRECEAKRREDELLVLQEKLVNKKSVEDLHHREELILEKDHDLEMHSRSVVEKEKSFSLLKEKGIKANEALKEKEKGKIISRNLVLQRSLDVHENKKKHIYHTEEGESMETETSELFVLELKLQEEIEVVKAQKQGLEVQANKMKELIFKLEKMWQLIIEKQKELQTEAECFAIEKTTLDKILKDELHSLKMLKDEHNNLKMLKDAMQCQYKHDNKSHSLDQEAYLITMEHERSEGLSKIQEERSEFLQKIEVQNKDLEDRLSDKCLEMKSYIAKRERAFKEEKKKVLLCVESLWEALVRETEQVNRDLSELDTKRRETNLDRSSRNEEWVELKGSTEEFKVQRPKLQKPRESMHADREEIFGEIEHLKQVEGNAIGFDVSSGKGSGTISPLSTPFSCLKRIASTFLEQGNKKIRHSEETRSPGMMSAQVDEHAVMSTDLTLVYANETSTQSAVHDEPAVIMPVNRTAEYANETCTFRIGKKYCPRGLMRRLKGMMTLNQS